MMKSDIQNSTTRSAASQSVAGYRLLNVQAAKRTSGGRHNSQAWMMTFADLIALMLTFFVMLFSMSHIAKDDWRTLVNALTPNLSAVNDSKIAKPEAQNDISQVGVTPGTDLDYLFSILEQQMAEDTALAQGLVRHLGDRIVISLPGELLFAPYSTKLGPKAEEVVLELGRVLGNLDNKIEVEGHADPGPSGDYYRSNWELSLARAIVLADRLKKFGYRGDLAVRGFGHSRFEQISTKLGQKRRNALARRVDIVVLDQAGETQQ